MRSDVFADDVVTGRRAVRLRSSSFDAAAFAAVGSPSRSWRQPAKAGGARRDRTDDLMLAKHALSQLSYGPVTRRRMPQVLSSASPRKGARSIRMVGLGRLELPTSRLSSARSNQLSYKPAQEAGARNRALTAPDAIARARPLARVRPRRKRNEDGEIPPDGAHPIWRSVAPDVSKTIR